MQPFAEDVEPLSGNVDLTKVEVLEARGEQQNFHSLADLLARWIVLSKWKGCI